MFGGLKNLAGMASLMGQAGDLQKKMAAAKERISGMQIEGSAGGDAVTVQITGDFQVTRVSIHQWLIEAKDRDLCERLIAEAMSQAIQKARETAAKEMAEITSGMNIPGMQEMLGKMGLE